jgi:hypothetical protein
MNVGIGMVAAQFLYWEYLFEFSVFCLCSVSYVYYKYEIPRVLSSFNAVLSISVLIAYFFHFYQDCEGDRNYKFG